MLVDGLLVTAILQCLDEMLHFVVDSLAIRSAEQVVVIDFDDKLPCAFADES